MLYETQEGCGQEDSHSGPRQVGQGEEHDLPEGGTEGGREERVFRTAPDAVFRTAPDTVFRTAETDTVLIHARLYSRLCSRHCPAI